uniref:Chloride channel protein n=1 Tax=Ditylenchus dipsaci TaxID=166011 RepID=A0A915D562_9BILA
MIKSVLEDWIFLALLGTIMAVLSLWMDLAIEYLHDWHVLLYKFTRSIEPNQVFNIIPLCAFSIWCLYSVGLVLASATFVHYVAPQAIGSGIPEMKTILRGVVLKEYLTLKTLIAKMVGLTLSLGSGMPLGKEGPFVHVASVVANLLNSLTTSYDNPHANESRNWEMLAAACAVGVSSTFSAPIGGVLFSIERIFAASCCAFLLNLLKFVTETEVTIAAFYQTSFPKDAFFPSEMPIFALIGVACGLLASIFILLQRIIVLFLRNNKFAKVVFQKHWMVYPIIVSLLISAAAYPHGFGNGILGPELSNIFPGIYSIVGAAAFVAGVTHTISVAVIVFELTGQVFYLLPVMLAVLIANTISSHLQPSIYDSMVKIKRLPYLPVIPYAFVDTFHGLKVEQFMTYKVHFLSRQSTYSEVRQLLLAQPQINTFPIVENPESSILIGTCSRRRLLKHIARKSGTRNPKRSPSVDKLHDIPTHFARVKDMQSVRIYTRHCKQDAPIINWLEVVDFDELEIDSALYK